MRLVAPMIASGGALGQSGPRLLAGRSWGSSLRGGVYLGGRWVAITAVSGVALRLAALPTDASGPTFGTDVSAVATLRPLAVWLRTRAWRWRAGATVCSPTLPSGPTEAWFLGPGLIEPAGAHRVGGDRQAVLCVRGWRRGRFHWWFWSAQKSARRGPQCGVVGRRWGDRRDGGPARAGSPL